MATITVTVEKVGPSGCVETEGAVDADVAVTLDGTVIRGEVTLVPAQYDGRLSSWGSPDNWLSGPLVEALYALDDADEIRGAMREIEAAVRAEASAS